MYDEDTAFSLQGWEVTLMDDVQVEEIKDDEMAVLDVNGSC